LIHLHFDNLVLVVHAPLLNEVFRKSLHVDAIFKVAFFSSLGLILSLLGFIIQRPNNFLLTHERCNRCLLRFQNIVLVFQSKILLILSFVRVKKRLQLLALCEVLLCLLLDIFGQSLNLVFNSNNLGVLEVKIFHSHLVRHEADKLGHIHCLDFSFQFVELGFGHVDCFPTVSGIFYSKSHWLLLVRGSLHWLASFLHVLCCGQVLRGRGILVKLCLNILHHRC